MVVPMSPYRPVLSLVLHSCGTLGRGHRRHQSPRVQLRRWNEDGKKCTPSLTKEATELLIECEEDRTLRAVLVGMLRDMERW